MASASGITLGGDCERFAHLFAENDIRPQKKKVLFLETWSIFHGSVGWIFFFFFFDE